VRGRKYRSSKLGIKLRDRDKVACNPIKLAECFVNVVKCGSTRQHGQSTLDSADSMPKADLIFNILRKLAEKSVDLGDVLVR
jgi:hypothetical protein